MPLEERQIILLYLYRAERKAFNEPLIATMERLVIFSRYIQKERLKSWVNLVAETITKRYFDPEKDKYCNELLTDMISKLKQSLEADKLQTAHQELEQMCFLFSGLINFN